MAEAPADSLLELLLPTLLLNIIAGSPANACIDAGHILRHAFGQFGAHSSLQLVDLVIRDRIRGDGVMYGTPEPSWDEAGRVFNGHCVLWLPESKRFIDATVEQFPMVRRLRMGPVIGRLMFSTEPFNSETPPPGTHIGVTRGDLLLLYTIAAEEFANLTDTPWIRERAGQNRRSGINLASTALDALRTPLLRKRALATPYPRLHALLMAVGATPSNLDDNRDVLFSIVTDTNTRLLRLDEIPLPTGTPADPTTPVG
ncbi:hypothetical protein [Pseudofrankia sp. DC12]|uniref:hypothetical protein n=1 Tax=Pseudofrankia sp. DC12 TaxID=683315 RepID=UPI0005F8827C|nr:hypothetical protein [Pseudofrankia sp. DC12]